MKSIKPEIIDKLSECVRVAGQIIVDERENFTITEKEGRGNFVTSADLKSEEYLITKLADVMPGVPVLSEETHSEIGELKNAEELIVIDPLDGTNNYRYGDTCSCVSLGLVIKGEPVAGFIFNPFRDELFTGVKGQGASLNGREIRTGNCLELTKARLVFENSYNPEDTVSLLNIIQKIKPLPWLRSSGCFVQNFCDLSCGRADVLIHNAIKPWDLAASVIILKEAGGFIQNFTGKEASIFDDRVVAGNQRLLEQLLEILL